MSIKKIAVLVSGGGTNLQALIDAQKNGKIKGGKIKIVISSKADAYALTRAKNAGIETKTVIRSDYPDKDAYTKALLNALEAYSPDLIVLAGFMCILGRELCEVYKNRIINVHPALIPSFCGDGYYGLLVHKAALEKGVKVSGATVHFVTADTDAGPIILQKAVEVLENDTPETLQKRIMEKAEWEILPEAVELFCNDKLLVENNRTKILR